MARRQRETFAQIIHQQKSRSPIRERTEGNLPPKKSGAGPTLASILRAEYLGPGRRDQAAQQAKAIIAKAGDLQPERLTKAHVIELDEQIRHGQYALGTRVTKSVALRRILRWLWEYHGSPKLDGLVRRHQGLRPRNVTAREDERQALLDAAPPYLRLWLLLCSDLALFSGTAAKMAPENYDPRARMLTLVTKYGAALRLPVTAEIAALLAECDMSVSESFTRQLYRLHERSRNRRLREQPGHFAGAMRKTFKALCLSKGITRRIVPHDLRRTTAVAVYKHTSNIRKVQALLGHRNLQSTIWYLDHDLEPVDVELLETVKKPFIVHRQDQQEKQEQSA